MLNVKADLLSEEEETVLFALATSALITSNLHTTIVQLRRLRHLDVLLQTAC